MLLKGCVGRARSSGNDIKKCPAWQWVPKDVLFFDSNLQEDIIVEPAGIPLPYWAWPCEGLGHVTCMTNEGPA